MQQNWSKYFETFESGPLGPKGKAPSFSQGPVLQRDPRSHRRFDKRALPESGRFTAGTVQTTVFALLEQLMRQN